MSPAPVTVPVNEVIPATDNPAPTFIVLTSISPPISKLPTILPPIAILPLRIISPSDTLTVPINPAACPEADDVAPTPESNVNNIVGDTAPDNIKNLFDKDYSSILKKSIDKTKGKR